jgi:hypothetical protein
MHDIVQDWLPEGVSPVWLSYYSRRGVMQVARGKSKKPGEPKCRGCGGLLEGRETVVVAGKKWHTECVVQKGKKIPKEYQKS